MEEMTPQEVAAARKSSRRHKYSAKKTLVDGILFPSKRQAKHYEDLKLRLSSGEISVEAVIAEFGRWMEIPFDLYGKNGGRVGRYTADFVYYDLTKNALVADEVKGYKVRDYALRKKLFLDNYPRFTFVES